LQEIRGRYCQEFLSRYYLQKSILGITPILHYEGEYVNSVGSQVEEIIIQALSHQARRDAIRIIASAEDGSTYSELMVELGLSTGKLNYHLGQLEGLVEKNEKRRYVLTSLGNKSLHLLNSISKEIGPNEQNNLKNAQISQGISLHPLAKSFLYISVAMISVILFIWAFLTYMVIVEGAPLIVYIVLPALLAIGIAIHVWLLYALKTSPEIFKRLERRLLGPNR